MTITQFINGRRLNIRVNKFLIGKSNECIFDILDDIQLLYNDRNLSHKDYTTFMSLLDTYIPES